MTWTTIATDLLDLASAFRGWGYGANLSVVEQDQRRLIDCSSLTARLLCKAFGKRVGGVFYQQVVLYADALELAGPWAPIKAVVDRELGEQITLDELADGEVAVLQVWWDESRSLGHQILLFRVGPLYAWLESREGVGPSWRGPDGQIQLSEGTMPMLTKQQLLVELAGGSYQLAVLYPRAEVASTVPSRSPREGAASARGLWTQPLVAQVPEQLVTRLKEALVPKRPSKNPYIRTLERAGYTEEQIAAILARSSDEEPTPKIGVWQVIKKAISPGEVLKFLMVVAEAFGDDGRIDGDEAKVIVQAAVQILLD